MGLQMKKEEDVAESIELKTIIYDEEKKAFDISESNASMHIQITTPLAVEKEYDPKDFTLFLLNNDECKENSIYQVYCEKKRLGWIFPIQSLLSKEHDYHEDIHFLRYAYIAIYLLLEGKDVTQTEVPVYKENLGIDDFYRSNSIVMILCNKNLNDIEEFDIEDCIVGLYKYGYSFVGKGNTDGEMVVGDKLKLERLPKELRGERFIVELFKDILAKEGSPLTRFHLLYQVIELLIGKIFDKELQKIVDILAQKSNSLFDVKEDLNELAGEKRRVKRLFNDCSGELVNKSALMDKCNELLTCTEKKTQDKVEAAIYSVRNLLVHDYRSIPRNKQYLIKEINSLLLDNLIDILLTYKEPN